MSRRTPLYDVHVAAGARMVAFAGWEMPLHYGSQLQEHHAVREHVGLFDVSHMTVLDITGSGAEDWLRLLLANDVARLQAPGAALYSAMLNERGGIIDDLIAYRLESGYRLVCNAATRTRVNEWIGRQARGRAVAVSERTDSAMIAVQGPAATTTLCGILSRHAATLEALAPFRAVWCDAWLVARTGYTGRTASRSCCRPLRPRPAGVPCRMPAAAPPGWRRATPCDSRPDSICTATRWTRTSRRWKRTWPGP